MSESVRAVLRRGRVRVILGACVASVLLLGICFAGAEGVSVCGCG